MNVKHIIRRPRRLLLSEPLQVPVRHPEAVALRHAADHVPQNPSRGALRERLAGHRGLWRGQDVEELAVGDVLHEDDVVGWGKDLIHVQHLKEKSKEKSFFKEFHRAS